nr:hypothetical protein [Tanacetum cinerariifolium]
MGKENMKEPVPHDLSRMLFLGHLKEQIGSSYKTRKTVCMIENHREVHKMKAQEDEGDMDVGWDITVEDVKRLRQFLTPAIYALPNLKPVVQLYMLLGPVHDKEKIIRGNKIMISLYMMASKDQASTTSYADDVMFSFFSNQSNALQLDNKNLEQMDTDDLEEMDLKWALRNRENRNRDAPTRNAPVDTSTTNALRKALNKYNLEIIGYQTGLESLEARIVVHENNEGVYEEDIAFLKYDVQVKDISIKDLKNQLENTLKEKDDLKLKLEKFETSSKKLTKLIDSQISAIDKIGLVCDGQMNESDLNDIHMDESEVLNNVFYSRKNNSVFKSKVSEIITSVPKIETNASKTIKDSLEKSKTVRSSDPLIKEWESKSEDENVFEPKEVNKTVKPSLENIEFVNARNTTVENENKAEIRPVWDNTARVNHQNKLTHLHSKRNFAPTVFLTKSGQVPVNVAKQSSHRAAASVSAARSVNTIESRPN